MKRFVYTLCVFAWCTLALALDIDDVREGDLLFVVSPNENAITSVTQGIDSLSIDHVSIVHYIGGEKGLPYVIEAIGSGVCLTPLDTLLSRATPSWGQHPLVLLGRINVPTFDVEASIQRALEYVGRPYDDLFLPGDSAIYCSELVLLSVVDKDGRFLLSSVPMSFHDSSGNITDFWTQHYRTRGLTVPEGEPGSNPGELSRRPEVTIIRRP